MEDWVGVWWDFCVEPFEKQFPVWSPTSLLVEGKVQGLICYLLSAFKFCWEPEKAECGLKGSFVESCNNSFDNKVQCGLGSVG